MDRRKFIKAAGASAVVAAVAGCVAEDTESGTSDGNQEDSTLDPPPSINPESADNEQVRQIMEALEWQNDALWTIAQD